MKPGAKFAIGALVIVGSVALMITEGIKQTGTYFMTPTELVDTAAANSHFYDIGLKVSAKVVRGSIKRDNQRQRVDFTVSDGRKSFPVVYIGSMADIPDTFTDANDIDVVVEGKLGREGTFHATSVIAKCGSRYEAAVQNSGKKA
jgi:cytochrome c-type biogenesis protein CcmE